MTTPICPPNYTCSFTQIHPRVIYHSTDPWYQGTAGWVTGLLIGLAICAVIAYLATLIHDARKQRLVWEHEQEVMKHKIEIEEQLTMQLDTAKGNPEVIKIIQNMQSRSH